MAKQPDSEKTKRDNCIPESTLPLNSDASLPQEEASVENRYAFLATTATEITLCQYMAPLLHSKLMEDNYIKDLLQAREKAEESDRLKSAFLANMSHEIRTPMNGILGFADLLKEPDLAGEEQQQYIRIIQQSGKRMLNIINDIVNISTIEAGLIKLNIQETDISKQIDFIYTFFKPEAGAKGLKLVIINTLTEKDTILKTDGEKVYAILTNLVKNALKYTHKGSIELRCEAEVKEDGTPQLTDIDVVLMDIRMPAMNGYEATKHIRQFNKDLIIIAQTAYGLVGDRENALAAGCNDYISKPINKTELLEILHKHLN